MLKPILDFETERLHIRSVRAEDRDAYMAIRVKTSEFSGAYSILPELSRYEWESELDGGEEIYLSAFLRSTGELAAIGSLQQIGTPVICIGFDVAETLRNQGLATELASALTKKAHLLFPEAEVLIKMRKSNDASRRVAEKCGGVFTGYEDTPVTKLLEAAAAGVGDPQSSRKLKAGLMDVMKQGKNGVCVYRMP